MTLSDIWKFRGATGEEMHVSYKIISCEFTEENLGIRDGQVAYDVDLGFKFNV